MNNQKTLLISLLITAVVIGLLETNAIQFNKESIHAQQETSDLVLEMGGERVIISNGDWIVAEDVWNPKIYAGGELVGVSADGLLIRQTKDGLEMNIPLIDIGTIYHGEYKSVGKYVRQGMKTGALFGLGCTGIIVLTSLASNPSGSGLDNPGCIAIAGSIIYGGGGTLSGGAIGFIRGMVADQKAEEFIIGPNYWQIVIE